MSATSALSLLQDCRARESRAISFGCSVLDRRVGPVVAQGITEVAGEAGCGKTQTCLVLALQAVVQSELRGAAAIMSCGEGAFPIKRLFLLAQEYQAKHPAYTAQELLGKVHIEECRNQENAVETLMKRLPEMCQKHNLRILIIDSLAGMIRFEYDTRQDAQMRERTAFLFNFAAQLKWLADVHKLAVVVVNQVTAAGIDENVDAEAVPALGLAWSTCVNTRIMLSKSKRVRYTALSIAQPGAELTEDEEGERDNLKGSSVSSESSSTSKSTRRTMRIAFSPCYPPNSIDFEIRNDGIWGIE